MKADKRVKRRKMNGKGMTLIEVIVAMAILAIVVVPTLRMFASSASTNHRSRLRQRATIVGESVMESFKAYSMDALCTQFMGGTFAGVTKSTDSALPTTMSAVGVYSSGEATPLMVDGRLNLDATSYKFKASNVVSEGQYYDVLVEATPRVQPTDVLNTEAPNAYSDAIICFDEEMNTDILTELTDLAKTKFAADYPTYVVSGVEISDYKREILLTVTDNGTVQKVVAKVTCTCEADVSYTYTTVGPSGTLVNGSGTETYDSSEGMSLEVILDEATSAKELTVYDNTDTIAGVTANGRKCKLNQIFLYYSPSYETWMGDGAKDEILINCTLTSLYDPIGHAHPEADGYTPLKVTVAKQLTTGLEQGVYNNDEVNYDVDVKGTLSGDGQVDFVWNLDENMSGMDDHVTPSVSGFTTMGDIQDGLVDKVTLLYDVVVYVYEPGTTKEIAKFTGTVNG